MSVFHSTVSRRDFMKFMSLTTGGVGGAAVIAPAFHDVDELMSASSEKRAWYIKERDFYNPTVEVDWTTMKRRDPTHTGQETSMMALYYGQDRANGASAKGTAYTNQQHAANAPGFTYRSMALSASTPFGTKTWPQYVSKAWTGYAVNANWKGAAFTGGVQTPDQRGEPKWMGTPEEGRTMLEAFMKMSGAGINGYGELDQKMQDKIVNTNVKNSSPIKIVFDTTTDTASQDAAKYVIPLKNPMFYFSNFEPNGAELFRGAPAYGGIAQAADAVEDRLKYSTYKFLRYLGYQMLGDGGDNSDPFIEGTVSVLSGVGELARQNLYVLTPEYGCTGRLHSYLTDLNVAPTKPIDAGMFRFCHSCHKCADHCPSNSISQEKEPSWDVTPVQGQASQMHNTGTKEFWSDGAGCRIYNSEIGHCEICWGTCTFTVNSKSMVHEIVKTTIVETSLFNSFFYKMGEAFGYGPSNDRAERWWGESYPALGFDSTRVAFNGGYKK